MKTPIERFEEKYRVQLNGCWVWTGSTNGGGYGELRIGGRKVYAHRFSVESTTGRPIPVGMQIDHLCRNHACVNPVHLEIVSLKENVRRGAGVGPRPERQRDRCNNGHLYADNTYIRPDGKGRNCVQCVRVRSREYQRRRREARGARQ